MHGVERVAEKVSGIADTDKGHGNAAENKGNRET